MACMGKIAASVILKLFMNSNKDATPLTPQAHERTSIFKCMQHTNPNARGQD